MVHLAKKKLLALLRALGLGNVARDFRGADDFSALIFDGDTVSEISRRRPSFVRRIVS
jgi:hypothetical protein